MWTVPKPLTFKHQRPHTKDIVYVCTKAPVSQCGIIDHLSLEGRNMARKSITHMQCIIKFLEENAWLRGNVQLTHKLYTRKYHCCIELYVYEVRVLDGESRENSPAVQVTI